METLLAVMMYVVLLSGIGLISLWVGCVWIEFRKDRVPSLLYHRFSPRKEIAKWEKGDDNAKYVCSSESFFEQMKYLKEEGYTALSLDEFLLIKDGRTALPERPIIITCDDGFESNYRYAFPVWKKFGLKATIFVTPDKGSPNFKKYQASDSPLTDEQIIEMEQNGISMESHGMTHQYLSTMPEDKIKWELTESKRVLEKLLGKQVKFLAIPSGAYNLTVKKWTISAGYEAVFGMGKGSNNQSSDGFNLKRVVVGKDMGISEFRELLDPWTSAKLRFLGLFQELTFKALGPGGIDKLRDWLYRTGAINLIRPRTI